ncbi:MAG TPA: PLP-dependent aminotransferase family protein [Thermoanaerobaculia bacterium]|nr:PLP-dependent aminotransferase family protein [Thermoanaerobaculia bacterium]
MPKRTIAPALLLPPREAGEPAQRWLCAALRAEILEGRLGPGARLPASRDLARQAGVARGTAVAAFEQLQAEGYVQGTVGSGTYVTGTLPDSLLQVARTARSPGRDRSTGQRPRAEHAPPRCFSAFGRRVQPFPSSTPGPPRAFRTDMPALDLFPMALWAQLTARRVRRASAGLLAGCGPLGYPPLQEAVAAYLGTARGVRCAPGQVAIVAGVQQALDLAARLLLDPGDRVAMEDPGYIGAALVFQAAGARISALPLDGQGLILPGARLRGVKLAYVTPAHQFPLGVAMSLARRLALLEWARRTGALIFEDDYDGEYRYAGRSLPALQGLDRASSAGSTHSVLFAGSFSKVMFPALRLGYLVVPPDLVDRVAAALSLATRHAPLLEQAVLCDFLAEGHFGRHVRRMREVYAERLGVLLEGARERLAGLLEITGVEAGLQTAGWLAEGIDEAAAAVAAARRNVEVTPLSRYVQTGQPGQSERAGQPGRPGLQLGFAAVDPAEIRRGVRELAAALDEVRPAR